MTPQDAWLAFESGNLEEARLIWESILSKASSQEEIDSANWGLGYVLVGMKRFEDAESIWSEIYDRTGDHKALHQVAMVKRDAGSFREALNIFTREQALIAQDDMLAQSVNFYELCYVNHLLGNAIEAERYLQAYERVTGQGGDLLEEACFYRLKGDVLAASDKDKARQAYESSKLKFVEAKDSLGLKEIEERLLSLRLDSLIQRT